MAKDEYTSKVESIVNEYNAKKSPTFLDDISTGYKLLNAIGKEARKDKEKDNDILLTIGASILGAAVGFGNGLKKRK